MFGLSLYLLTSLAVLPPVTVAPLPASAPKVLLRAPVVAEWAADHADYWREKGIDGILFSGILDDPLGDRGTDDNVKPGDLPDIAQRLSAAGVSSNFIYTPLAPERPYFADDELVDRAVRAFDEAGGRSQSALLSGLALDTCTTSLFYDPLWDGYRPETHPPDELERGARAFGRRIVRAFLAECPNAEILVLADGTRTLSDLWVALFEGILDATRTNGTAAVTLLIQETGSETDPGALAAAISHCDAFLHLHLSEQNLAYWERVGALAPGMCPLARAGTAGAKQTLPIACYPPAAFRRQVVAAKAFASRYVWIDSAGQTWWRIENADVNQYGDTAAVRAQAASVVGDLDQYTARTPLDGLERVGALDSRHGPVFVFRDEAGAQVLFWNLGGQPQSFDTDAPVLHAVALENGRRESVPVKDGSATVSPLSGPVLVGPLPLADWVSPAGLWYTAESLSGTSVSPRRRVRYGFVNRTDFTVSGTLQLVAPTNVFLSPEGHADFSLAPGEAIAATTVAGGRLDAGAEVTWRVVAAIDGGRPIGRMLTSAAPPGLFWQRSVSGPVLAPPAVDVDGPEPIAYATASGEVTALDLDGTQKWTRFFPSRFNLSPAVAREGRDGFRVAVVDTRGQLRVVGPHPDALWERPLGTACALAPVLVPQLGMFDSSFFFPMEDGTYSAWRTDGEPVYKGRLESGPCRAVEGNRPDMPGPQVFVVSGGESPVASVLSVAGNRGWETRLEGDEAVCGPVLANVAGDDAKEVLFVTRNGELVGLDAATGKAVCRYATGSRQVPLGMAAADLVSGGPDEVVVARPGGMACYAGDERVWTVSLTPSTAPCVAACDSGVRIVVGEQDGALACVSADGKVLWRDTRAVVSPVTALTVFNAGARGWLALYAAGDRMLRAVAVE